MPRQLTADMTLDTLEDEILYTQASIQADPDAADLFPKTSSWLSSLDEVRTADRSLRQAIANTDASRMVANQRLDIECQSFGRDLLYDVQNDRSSPRWKQYFPVAPSIFIKKPLSVQVTTVRAWLTGAGDTVLETHRANLTSWSGTADTALVSTSNLQALRQQQWNRRLTLATTLTQGRDALHRDLGERAVDRKLPREWADVFFRTDYQPAEKKDTGTASSEATTASPPPATAASEAGTGASSA